MASPDGVFPAAECCEICGVVLGDEVIMQTFADGSLVRLCPECAAGADLSEHHHAAAEAARGERAPATASGAQPAAGGQPADSDPLDKTRELLVPMTDLITLQREMQSALERLASSLERFAAEVLTESQDKTALVEGRLQVLEHELDKTRARLNETEFLLTTAAPETAGTSAATGTAATATGDAALSLATSAATGGGAAPAGAPAAKLPRAAKGGKGAAAAQALAASAGTGASSAAASQAGPATPAAPAGPPTAAALAAATGQAHPEHQQSFRIEEVQAAQRYYNECHFVERVRDVRRSIGRPKANLTRLAGAEPLALVTVFWDIVWYQYLVDLRRDLPSTYERVTLHREGMDLDELAYHFKEKNAVVNDDGRLDASELEVRLLSDPSALISEMTPEAKLLAEDATDESWDRRIAPEFKWDD